MKKVTIYVLILVMVFIVGCQPVKDKENQETTTESNQQVEEITTEEITSYPEEIIETTEETSQQVGNDLEDNESVIAPFELVEGAVFEQNIAYDEYKDTVFDIFYMPDNEQPSGAVLYIHGGGFMAGDKGSVYEDLGETINELLSENIAFISINYRLLQLGNNDGLLRSLEDSMYALQTLKYRSDDFNLDKDKFVLSGTSAGAGTSLWIGLHDDMLDESSTDPIKKESTRVKGIAVYETQASYDLKYWETVFWEYGFRLEEYTKQNPMFSPMINMFYGEIDINGTDTESIEKINDLNMCLLFSEDDPDIWANNTTIEQVYPTDLNILFHHPNHVRSLQEAAISSDVRVVAYYSDYMDPSQETYVEFIHRVIEDEELEPINLVSESHSVGKTSPNGEYIAYISPYDFELNGSLWLYNTETGENQKVVDLDSTYDETIRNIEWIDDNSIYYIKGFALGTVSLGGELYAYDLNTEESMLMKRIQDDKEIIDVNVEGETVTLSMITFDEDYMSYTTDFQEYQVNELPLEEVFINEDRNNGQFMIETYEPIYNIKLIMVYWNEEEGRLEDGKILYEMESAEKQIIVVDSILPEGAPQEKLIWEDAAGNLYAIDIAYNGRTGNHYFLIN